MTKWVEPDEFAMRMVPLLTMPKPGFVTGPGRSGAMAAVYASYLLGVPFVPYGVFACDGTVLIVDTAAMSGRTIRKSRARYEKRGFDVHTFVAFDEAENRHHFWYERMAMVGV